jgi:asparagine synthase (glutamine-hydrolysing)
MCGIAGLLYATPTRDDGELLRSFSRSLAHRGPDGHGFLRWSADGQVSTSRDLVPFEKCQVALAHSRLAILDLTDASHQPMSTPDGRFHLVFNGEIYNFVELRNELEQCGVTFRSSGDTEVLLAALAAWGQAALKRLVGMFAFALLDVKRRSVILARDPFGIKPLYYTDWQRGVAFASELKPLVGLPGVGRRVSPQQLYDYLTYGLTDYASSTMVDGVFQVPAASVVEISADDVRAGTPQVYWRPDLGKRIDVSFKEAASRLRELFLDSVRLHMRSDVPIGAALSGGIDSSAIVTAMRRIAGSSLNLQTFTYVATGSRYDEERYADLAGREAGAQMHKVQASPDELLHELDQLIHAQDEPFGSTSIYAQYRVFRSAAERGVKVMLDGQGADELLGGYRHFLAARIASLVRRGRLAAATRLWRRAKRLPSSGQAPPCGLHALGLLLPRPAHTLALKAVGRSPAPSWLSPQWLAECDVKVGPPTQARGPCYLRNQLWTTIRETSLPSLLRYEDRNSMHHSIESRVPFLTPALVEFVLALPEEYIVGYDGTSKRIFREAIRDIAPDEILSRRDKIGFATPESAWMRELTPWIERVLGSDVADAIPAIRANVMRAEWGQFLRRGRRFDFRFWRWVNLIRWIEREDMAVS